MRDKDLHMDDSNHDDGAQDPDGLGDCMKPVVSSSSRLVDLLAIDTGSLDYEHACDWVGKVTNQQTITYAPFTLGLEANSDWTQQRIEMFRLILEKVDRAKALRGRPSPVLSMCISMATELIDDQYEFNKEHKNRFSIVVKTRDEEGCMMALELMDRAIKVFPLDYQTFLIKHVSLFLLEDERALGHKNAYYCMKDAANGDATGPAISYAIGEMYKEAYKYSKKGIRMNRRDPAAWYIRGIVLNYLGKEKKALKAFDECQGLDPDSALGWIGMGFAYESMGQTSKAIGCFNRAG